MKNKERSRTAEWVAWARWVGAMLPGDEVLVHDPYGMEFITGPMAKVFRFFEKRPRLSRFVLTWPLTIRNTVLWMQLRTRAIDEALLSFVEHGGRQVVVLGAGHDMRAARLAGALGDARMFEVDHPETQAAKRETIARLGLVPRCTYVPFDFVRDGVEFLLERLAREGHVCQEPTLTIWEGVTMYLTEPAINATLRAIRAYSAPGSEVALTYMDMRIIRSRNISDRLTRLRAAWAGEPYLFGFTSGQFAPYVAERGFQTVFDLTDCELCAQYMPRRVAEKFAPKNGSVALLRV